MEFLNPWMLGFAATAAVPVVLHLIMRQQPVHVVFPALRFLKQQQQVNQRRMRLRHLILLLLRIAALCLLALALARPSLNSSGISSGREAPVSAVLIFDTSPSMLYLRHSETRLQQAQQIGSWLVNELPADSQVAVLDSSLSSAVFQVDAAAAEKRIERLEITPAPRDMVDLVGSGLEILTEAEHPAKELYLFTDLTRSGWSPAGRSRLAALLEQVGELGIHVVDVGIEDPQNTALGNIRLPDQVVARNSPITLITELSRLGAEEEKTVQVSVTNSEGVLQKRNQASARVGDGVPQQLEFQIAGLGEGVHQGEVRVLGQDGLAVDDRRYFTVKVQAPWRVLVAAPDPPEAYAWDLMMVLAPKALVDDNKAPFDCEVVSQDKLADTDLALSNYSTVYLLDPRPLSVESWNRLADYASGGGRVAIFLGRNAAQTESFNSPAAQALLPAPLVQQAHWPEGKLHLAPPDYQRTMLAGFRGLEGEVSWDRFPVFRYWQLAANLNPGVDIVIPYSNNDAALLERAVGRGLVLTMTTPVSDELDESAWNILPTGLDPLPSVILTREMAAYLAGSSNQQFNYVAANSLSAEIPLDSDHGIAGYRLTSPSGDQSIRKSNLAEPRIAISSISEIGNYRVEASEINLDSGFSVNVAASQSDLTRMPREELDTWFEETPFDVARQQEEIERNVNTNRLGYEMFPLLIMLVAVVIAAEQVLSNRFYRDT